MFLPADRRPDTQGYDCVVIGSGPAGLTLALELEHAQRRVLVIESESGNGDLPSLVGYGHFAGTYWNAHWLRGFGGTSNAWGGWTVPMRALDFDHPVVGMPWPITLEDLRPYYPRAANLLNRSRAVARFEQPLIDGWVYRPFSLQHPTRFGERFRANYERSTFIDIALGHSVVGLDATPDRSSVTGLRCFDHRTTSAFALPLRSNQSLVVAAGAMGNAQLLLQPPEDGGVPVGNESGHVGKFLMEHPHVHGAAECLTDIDFSRVETPANFGNRADAILPSAEVEVANRLLACSLQFHAVEAADPMANALTPPGRKYINYVITTRSEMQPTAANRVQLTLERSRSGLFSAVARCVIDADDLRNVERTLRLFGDTLIKQDRGRVRIVNDAIYRQVTGGGHTLGTTRMGDSRSTSVVDRDCRVHGYDNLFVAGSSVFTTGGYSNPTFTIVALAMRLAETIAKRAAAA